MKAKGGSTPTAERSPEDEKRYQTESWGDEIAPHSISPLVEGYYRLPAVWLGREPEEQEQLKFDARVHCELVVERKLQCGVSAKAFRNGMFLFDFSAWEEGPSVFVPGFTKPANARSYKYPDRTQRAEGRAETIAVKRAQAMNAHQACMATAERILRAGSGMMGFALTAWSTYKAWDMQAPLRYNEDTEDLTSFARIAMDRAGTTSTTHLPRRCIALNVVEKSLDLFDLLLCHNEKSALLVYESLYQAACRNRDKRYGEAITLAWSVCEQMISIMWRKHLQEHRTTVHPQRMPKARFKKLTGRDYTASIMTENLELSGKLSHKVFQMLEVGRKARNKWAHELSPPTEQDVRTTITVAEMLIEEAFGVPIKLSVGGRGGVPKRFFRWFSEADQTRFFEE